MYLDYAEDQADEMIRDAMAGEFDLVITKSISRFGRNTKDVLEYTRLLKKHNYEVWLMLTFRFTWIEDIPAMLQS